MRPRATRFTGLSSIPALPGHVYRALRAQRAMSSAGPESPGAAQQPRYIYASPSLPNIRLKYRQRELSHEFSAMSETASHLSRPSLRLRLENFRLFRDSGWFRLAPLTCLVGRNSSGKSSVLSALLLLKQSIEQETMGEALTPLTLAGPYCDLGNYTAVVHRHSESAELSISVAVLLADLTRHFREKRPPLVRLAIPRSRSMVRFGYFGRWMETALPETGSVEARLTFSAAEPFGPSLSRIAMSVSNVGAARFVRTVSGERRQHWRVYTDTLPPRSLALRLSPRAFFPLIDVRSGSYNRSARGTRRRLRTFAGACQLLFRFLTDALWQSDVIGPFRTPPERRYAFGGFSAARKGPSGQQAVDLLITEALLRSSPTRPLHAALSFWIRHLRLAQSLDVKDIAKRLNLFEVDIAGAGPGTRANLVDVGFGVSQILPVLVQGLLMQPGGIYLVQQPEIHLHPDAQAGLADFFIYLAAHGIITVVETHSEYLLLRLRRRLAEGAKPLVTGVSGERGDISPLTPDDVAVLFTGATKRAATVRQLEIGESFQFDNLPSGFMSQALEDRVALLRAVSRRNG